MAGGAERLQDKVCVLTGAASPLARAVADRLTLEGATVVGVDMLDHGVGVQARQADLTDEDQVRELFASVRSDLGRVDVLYNSAGLNDPDDHSVLDMPLAVWETVLAANLTTTFLCCKHVVPHLLENDPPGGSIINTASFLAVMGAASSQMAYSVAKAGVVQLSRDLGVHLARTGVRVNAVILGPIETPQLRALFDRIGDQEIARRFAHYPMGRFGTPEELAGTVAYLASDDAGFVTGAAFPLDGGITSAFTVPS
ncbi:MAG TPA: SDR family oxidoreductase [Solirubrobacteraceae bacterium]|nr:SDR family oxidoreductase [Solirubrobacteraceae bacterium]